MFIPAFFLRGFLDATAHGVLGEWIVIHDIGACFGANKTAEAARCGSAADGKVATPDDPPKRLRELAPEPRYSARKKYFVQKKISAVLPAWMHRSANERFNLNHCNDHRSWTNDLIKSSWHAGMFDWSWNEWHHNLADARNTFMFVKTKEIDGTALRRLVGEQVEFILEPWSECSVLCIIWQVFSSVFSCRDLRCWIVPF